VQAVSVFAMRLKKDRMLSKIKFIVDSYEKFAKAQSGKQDIVVTSAHTLTKSVVAELKKVFHADEIDLVEDKELIGGVVVRTQNTIFDSSIKGQLQSLGRSLNS